MGIKIFDSTNSGGVFENTAQRSTSRALRALRQGAGKIESLAKRMAPVDEGNLEDAITTEETRDGINGRIRIGVGVDESIAVPGRPGKTIGSYATEMHEGLFPGSKYKLGEKSANKQMSDPTVMVGGKYLERALDELEAEVVSDIEQSVRESLGL